MRMPWPRRSPLASTDTSLLQPLEPRIVLDGTPDDPSNPVVEVQTRYGNIYIELFPDVAPATVENFLGYVERDDYDGTFFHRHVNNFVLQGGGWVFDEFRQDVDHITQQDPVENEFSLSNVKWTVAMAKLGGDPDSATSEWFINLADNSGNLDNQNGGFTVFGEVVGGRDVVEEITGLRVVNLGGGFETVPVTAEFEAGQSEILDEDLVIVEDVVIAYDPNVSLIGDVDGHISGSANGANRTTVVLPSEFGRPLAFQQDGSGAGWTVVDLNLKTGTSGNARSPVTWVDPKDGRTYAAAISDDGLLLYRNVGGTAWTVRNLNQELPGVEEISSSLTVFVAQGRLVYLAGLTADGDMMLFNQNGAASGGEFRWAGRNLSDTDLAGRGQDTPAFESTLSSYVTSWNGLNIVGLDANGDVQGVWWAPGQTSWQVSNLSDLTGAPPMQGSLAPYLTAWNAINLAGTDADGNVIVTWWTPSIVWTTSNLTSAFGGPELTQGSVATYVTPWGGTNVLGTDDQGRVVVYWWAPGVRDQFGDDNWRITVLSDFIQGAEVPTGEVIGFSSPSGTVNIFGAAADGDLIRYWWKPNDAWQWENVSSEAVLS